MRRYYQNLARRLLFILGSISVIYLFSLLASRDDNADSTSMSLDSSNDEKRILRLKIDSFRDTFENWPQIESSPKSGLKIESIQLIKNRLPPENRLLSSIATRPTVTSPLGTCNYMTLKYEENNGGLGSTLFQYASLYGISKLNKKLPILPPTFPLYADFELSIPRKKIRSKKFENLLEKKGCCLYQDPTVPCNANVTLGGYRRSWRYFHVHRQELKRELRFTPRLRERCRSNLTDIFKRYDVDPSKCLLIGVHARVGPFWSSPSQNGSRYDIDTGDYLRRAIGHFRTEFREEYSCIIYLILGNDYDWIYQTFVEDRELLEKDSVTLIAIHQSGDPVTDLCILTQTNHTIFTYGTMGWWVAYLTGGLVTYQKEYADLLVENKEYGESDYFLPEWVAL